MPQAACVYMPLQARSVADSKGKPPPTNRAPHLLAQCGLRLLDGGDALCDLGVLGHQLLHHTLAVLPATVSVAGGVSASACR